MAPAVAGALLAPVLAGGALWPAIPGLSPSPASAAASSAHTGTANVTFRMAWRQVLPDQNVDGLPGLIAQSSPILAQFPGGPVAVVGDTGGKLYAFRLSDGSQAPGWPVTVGTPVTGPVDSPPSAVALPGSKYDTVFVGAGSFNHPTLPFGFPYQAFNASGQRLWAQTALDGTGNEGVEAGMTVFGGAKSPKVTAGGLGLSTWAFNAVTGKHLWTFFNWDSTWSTAASGDFFHTGQTDFLVGGDSTYNPGAGSIPPGINGGRIHVLDNTGKELCQVMPQPTQTITSSPAMGPLFSGALGAVVGTGNYWPGGDTDHLIALWPNCTVKWNVGLDGTTLASPALANVLGTPSHVQVVEVTDRGNSPGSVWVLSSSTGQPEPGWPKQASDRITGLGGPVTADLSGLGYQDIVVPTISGTDVFDGKSGRLLTVLGTLTGTQSTPLVTRDPNGQIGITVAGYQGTKDNCPIGTLPGAYCLQGVVSHYVVTSPGASIGPSTQSWPMFHHDPQLTGNLENAARP